VLVAAATLSLAGKSEAATSVQLDQTAGAIYIQVTGAQRTETVSLRHAGTDQPAPLTPLVDETERTAWRSGSLPDGVYDVPIGNRTTIHAQRKGIALDDLLFVERQVSSLRADVQNVTTGVERQEAIMDESRAFTGRSEANVTSLAEEVLGLRSQATGIRSAALPVRRAMARHSLAKPRTPRPKGSGHRFGVRCPSAGARNGRSLRFQATITPGPAACTARTPGAARGPGSPGTPR